MLAPSVGHATRPPPNKGNQVRKWELFHLLKNQKLGNCVECDQGKRRFVLTKNRITRLCPRISPFLEGANGLFQLLQQHSESLPMVDCPVTRLQQSPEHPPLSLSSLHQLQKNRNPESK